MKGSEPQCGVPLNDKELKKMLTPEQYRIMRQNGTEAPFKNAYWDNKRAGIYVDAITGQPLFSSKDKFHSSSGWPSFTKPIENTSVVEKPDTSLGMTRTEVRSKSSDSHLGHVFDDGSQPTELRYCINSASLRFVPVEDMEKMGYAEYLPLFTDTATFGAGCFWGVEAAFRQVKGVAAAEAGFMGGTVKNPSYEQVCAGGTGHAEVVRVRYDPTKVSYEKLLSVFWSIHDPTTQDRQGPDVGAQYRSAIFYHTPEQGKLAASFKEKIEKDKKYKDPIVTQILPAGEFYKAEDYHQRYYEKRNIEPTCRIGN